ncbi:TIGR03087 family PEP-CTERM/XrtA system glycosyltransferase [Alteromonas sp. AMM-1]|uniref:TIGR03087 family PEP-CTERM/XrtA system glycosyltransferase n=1 Tax=Alteromonas sp. AMM-1 TaxID=3394233 RepID=UPI0039A5F92D
MHCLYLAQRVPFPPNKGEKLRSFHQINFLRQQGIAITVAAPMENDTDESYFQQLESQYGCATLYSPLGNKLLRYANGMFRNASLSEAHFYCPALQHQVDQLLATGQIDAVICTASSMAGYVFRSSVLPTLAEKPTLIMDFMDMDSNKWDQYTNAARFPMNWVYKREAHCIRRLEKHIGDNFDACFFVAEPETVMFKTENPSIKANVVTIGNGIDPAEFHPAASIPAVDVPKLLFAGVMDYAPNVDAMMWFNEHVWPSVLAKWPTATLTIAGMNPTADIQQLGNTKSITVTGFVDDILPYFHQSNVFVAPFRIARGIQNKILQAFACGLPVVATSMGAEGIVYSEGENILLGDNPASMFNAIELLMDNQDTYLRLRQAAINTIAEHYSWQGKLQTLLKLLPETKEL